MKHSYLSDADINIALKNHEITEKEAKKLHKKVDCQIIIYNTIKK